MSMVDQFQLEQNYETLEIESLSPFITKFSFLRMFIYEGSCKINIDGRPR